MLFLLHPIQRFAESHSSAGSNLDGTPGATQPPADPSMVYREQVRLAWGDGRLTPKERALLDHLRVRLNLGRHEASGIEAAELAARVFGEGAACPRGGLHWRGGPSAPAAVACARAQVDRA